MTASDACFEHSEEGGERTLCISGEIDLAVRHDLRTHLDTLIAAARSAANVDLSAVTFLDSSGLGELIAASKRAGSAGVHLVIVAASPQVRRVLSLAGVTEYLDVRD